MKRLNTMLTKALILFSLLLPWAASEALETYERAGLISKISYSSFNIRDREYRLSPTARIQFEGKDKAKLSDFKNGDRIWFKGIILNGVYYVETIVYSLPIPS